MRQRIAGLVFVLFLFPVSVQADVISVEPGLGVSHSSGSSALFLRYQRDGRQLFGHEGFYAASYGSWTGSNRNEAISLARGILWTLGENAYVSFEAGLARIRRTTGNLDTPFEILLRAAYGYRIGRLEISLGFEHYSNGKKLFRNIYPPWWEHGPNFGEYFPTLMLGVRF